MNPYSRFGLVSNTVSAAALLSLLAIIGPGLISSIELQKFSSNTETLGAIGGLVTVMVIVWITLSEAILPSLFRLNSVRRMVLGKYYFEGTWLQSEKGEGHNRLSVIDIQPDGKGFIFSGYSLNEELEIESNTLIEFSKLEWPFMTYKYRNSLSDGADGRRDGVGEIQFEMNRASSRRYNGFVQYVRYARRARIEGAKLTSNSEVRNLRTLQGRQKVFQKYWDLFFNASLHSDRSQRAAPVQSRRAEVNEVPVVDRPAAIETTARPEAKVAQVERRAPAAPPRRAAPTEGVVPRRRATDWEREQRLREESFKGAPLEKSETSGRK